MGQRNQFQSQGAIQEPSAAQMGQKGQSVGRGQVQSPQARMSKTQGHAYTVVPQAEHVDQPDMQGTFYTCNYFCIMFIIVAPRVIDLGLEVEAFREMMGNSSLGSRVRVGHMYRDSESEISVILLMVDLKVVEILGVDVILDMDELTAIGLSVIGTLTGLSYSTWSWSWVRLHIHLVGCVCAWNFRTKLF